MTPPLSFFCLWGVIMTICINPCLRLASLISIGSGLLVCPTIASAQCSPSGCSSPAPQVGLPAITSPASAQSVTLQARVAVLESRMAQMIAASSSSVMPSFQGNAAAKSAAKAYLASMNARTWINGEGLWQMSPRGVTCQLSSSVSNLNSSPCSSSF